MLELLQNFHFIRPLGLLLIPIGTLIWWSWNRHQDPLRGWRVQMDPVLLEALVVGGQSSGQARGLATLVGWLIAALAIAGPTWQLEPSPFVEDAAPMLVLLKADLSGQVPALSPTTMERARLKIADLAEARQGQALGLIAYAGSAHLVLPPTKDTKAVALLAAEIGPEVMPVRGDRLDLALAEAQRMLDNSDQVGSIVVLADTIGCDQKLLDQWRKANSTAVQILAIQSPSAEVDASVRAVGQRLKAPVEVWDPVGNDVAAIVRRGSNVARFQRGEQGGQWQEAGWWLVPAVGLAMLVRFRVDARGAGP